MMSLDPVVLRYWRRREMRFPKHVRRFTPDALDMASGAWDRAVGEAAQESSDVWIDYPATTAQGEMEIE